MTETGASRARSSRFTLGLVVHPTKPVSESLATVTRWSRSQGIDVIGRRGDEGRLAPGIDTVGDEEMARRVDALLSLGGDGTMLAAMRLVVDRPVPVLGVNHGHLGFLIEVAPNHLADALARLVEGRFTVQPNSGLRISLTEAGADAALWGRPVAFNDVVLSRRGASGGVSLDLSVNGSQYGYYRCDALVISTPTGSTAYSYAAGGPVVSPSAAVTLVTPVAPMAGISRSVVLAADDVLTLHAEASGGAVHVDTDGVPAGVIEAGQSATLGTVPQPALVVRLDSDAHARRAIVKLSLQDLPLRPDQLRELIPLELRRAPRSGG